MLTRTLRPVAAARTFRPPRYAYSIAIPTPSPSPSSSSSSLHSAASSFGSSSSLDKPQVIPPNPQVVRHLAEEEGLDEPELTPVEEAFVYVTPSAWNVSPPPPLPQPSLSTIDHKTADDESLFVRLPLSNYQRSARANES